MTDGDIHTVRIPVTLDYLAPADTSVTFVDLLQSLDVLGFDQITSTIIDVSGRNSIRKTVFIVTAREI